MNKIGFRVNLDDYILDKSMLDNFLKLYFSKFNIMEIKVNDTLINSSNFDYLLSVIDDKEISYHISKNFLVDFTKNDETLISSLANKKEKYLITHIPDYLSFERIEYVLNKLPNNLKILCENPNFFNTKAYINYLIDFYKKIEYYEKIGGCLDLGHLFFNQHKTSNLNYLKQLLENINFDNIYEFHIHDFDDKTDHKKIGEGLLDIEYINSQLNTSFSRTRVILETNVNDEKLEEGIKQIKRVLKHQ